MANFNMRIDDDLKRETEALFADLGLSMAAATTMFYRQCLRSRGLPFQPTLDPFYSDVNQDHLRRAIADLDAGRGKPHDLIEVDDD